MSIVECNVESKGIVQGKSLRTVRLRKVYEHFTLHNTIGTLLHEHLWITLWTFVHYMCRNRHGALWHVIMDSQSLSFFDCDITFYNEHKLTKGLNLVLSLNSEVIGFKLEQQVCTTYKGTIQHVGPTCSHSCQWHTNVHFSFLLGMHIDARKRKENAQ